MATAGRQLSAMDTLLKRGIISPEKHATEVAALKARLGSSVAFVSADAQEAN